MTTSATPSDDSRKAGLDRTDESQDFVDRSVIDFDPDDGLYSGTAVTGTSKIPEMNNGADDEDEDAPDKRPKPGPKILDEQDT